MDSASRAENEPGPTIFKYFAGIFIDQYILHKYKIYT